MSNVDLNFLKSFKFESDKFSIFSFTNISWKIQDCNAETIIFLNVQNSENFLNKYSQYLNNSGLIITTNPDVYSHLKGSKILIANENFLELRKEICDLIYDLDINKKYIGITGTNGKTSIANYLTQMLKISGTPVISIGTLGVFDGVNYLTDFGLTSPDYVDIRKTIHLNKSAKVFIFEVSSHALVQKRFYEFKFDIAVWTNLTLDHLDYHGDFKNYFEAKKLILSHLKPNGKFFVSQDMVVYLERIKYRNTVICDSIEVELKSSLDTSFNRKNLGICHKILQNEFKQSNFNYDILAPVPGRYNRFKKNGLEFIVDFAHTPDALENILLNAKQKNKKLVLVFGCGGNRDKSKRSKMGEIADKYADVTYLTNDNPRFEEPISIINDIIIGFKKTKPIVELDRSKAIKMAANESDEYKVVVVAGKGHEEYIEIKGVKHPYCDIDVVKKLIDD